MQSNTDCDAVQSPPKLKQPNRTKIEVKPPNQTANQPNNQPSQATKSHNRLQSEEERAEDHPSPRPGDTIFFRATSMTPPPAPLLGLLLLLILLLQLLHPIEAQVGLDGVCADCLCECAANTYAVPSLTTCYCKRCPPGTFRTNLLDTACSVQQGPETYFFWGFYSATQTVQTLSSGMCSYVATNNDADYTVDDFSGNVLIDPSGDEVPASNYISENVRSVGMADGLFLYTRQDAAACGSLTTKLKVDGTTLADNQDHMLINVTRNGNGIFTLTLYNSGSLPLNVVVDAPNYMTITNTMDNTPIGSPQLVESGTSNEETFDISIDASGIDPSQIVKGLVSTSLTITASQFWTQASVPDQVQQIAVDIVLINVTVIAIPSTLNILVTSGQTAFGSLSIMNLSPLKPFNFELTVNYTGTSSDWLALGTAAGDLDGICLSSDSDQYTSTIAFTAYSSSLFPTVYTAKINVVGDVTIVVPVVLTVSPGALSASSTTWSWTTSQPFSVSSQVGVQFTPRDGLGAVITSPQPPPYVVIYDFDPPDQCPVGNSCHGVLSTNGRSLQLLWSFPVCGNYSVSFYQNNSGALMPIADGNVPELQVNSITCTDPNSSPVLPAGASCACNPGFGTTTAAGVLQVICKECDVDFFSIDSSCEPCPSDLFTLSTQSTRCICTPDLMITNLGSTDVHQSCTTCPTGAFCRYRTADDLLPLYGYWAVPWNKTLFAPCRNPAACPGVVVNSLTELYDDTLMEEAINNYTQSLAVTLANSLYSASERAKCEGQQICNTGYIGPLCVNCDIGYMRIGTSSCMPCFAPSTGMIALLLSGMFLAALFTVHTIRRAIQRNSLDINSDIMMIKILASHLQVVSMSSAFKLQWPTWLNSMYDIFDALSSAAQTLWTVECLVNPTTIEETCLQVLDNTTAIFMETGTFDPNRVRSFYFEALALAFIPVIWLLGTALFWGSLYFHWKSKNMRKGRSMFAYFVVSNVVLLFFLYPTLSRTALKFFSCSPEDPGVRFLESDFNIVCWGSNHLEWALTLGVLMTAVYAIGIPLYSFRVLHSHVKKLSKYKDTFGFLFSEYKPDYYYWEVVIMLRKLSFAFIAVIFNILGSDVQAYTGMFVLGVCLLLQTHVRPYENSQYNFAEWLGLLTAFMTLFLGLFIASPNVSGYPPAATVFAVIIVIINAAFLLYILRCMYQASTHITHFKLTDTFGSFHVKPHAQSSVESKPKNSESFAFEKSNGVIMAVLVDSTNV